MCLIHNCAHYHLIVAAYMYRLKTALMSTARGSFRMCLANDRIGISNTEPQIWRINIKGRSTYEWIKADVLDMKAQRKIKGTPKTM